MALTGEQLVDEVQALTGRTGDTVLCSDARCTRWCNEAQHDIVKNVAGIPSQTFKNTTSMDTTALLRYSIDDITVGDVSTSDKVCRVWGVSFLNGLESQELRYVHIDEFDTMYPDPTYSDVPTSSSEVWTRRGGNIEIMPMCTTAYQDKDLRFDGDWYAGDFTTNDASASDLSDCDKGIIRYAVAQAWGAIGDEAKAKIWEGKYEDWLREFKDKNDLVHAWGGGMYEDME